MSNNLTEADELIIGYIKDTIKSYFEHYREEAGKDENIEVLAKKLYELY